jgi:hypothetical protein
MKDKVEIFGDLDEGDPLIAKANDEIKDGQPVQIRRTK